MNKPELLSPAGSLNHMRFAYAYGAFVLDKKTFSKLPPEYAELMKTASQTHFSKLLADTRKSNEEALQVLQENGIAMVKPTPSARAELQNNYMQMTVDKLIDDAFSKGIYEETVRHLDNYHKEMAAGQK